MAAASVLMLPLKEAEHVKCCVVGNLNKCDLDKYTKHLLFCHISISGILFTGLLSYAMNITINEK